MGQPYRLGIDIGTNSIGWAVVGLNGDRRPDRILDLGINVFPDGRDPQSGTSLAVDRRIARGMRRRRDRYLRRRSDLMAALIRHGLMPKDKAERKALENLDPYELRARGLDRKLTRHELGRALFHLHQRRGFRSNRKSESGADKETGLIKEAVGRLRGAMAEEGARTLGEFLWRRHEKRDPVRARLHGEGKEASYDFYPERALVEEEFDALWFAQAGFDPALTDAMREDFRRILFRQRPLRPVDPGKCALDPHDSRAPWALPRAQLFRIYQELANLRVIAPDLQERPLTLAERDLLAARLRAKPKCTFEQARRALKLSAEHRFNLTSEKRDHLKGDQTAVVLAHRDRFGKAWRELDLETQTEIVERLLDEEDEEALVAWLVERHGFDRTRAEKVSAASLPPRHCRLGRGALAKILPILMTESEPGKEFVDPETGEVFAGPIGYAAAAERAGYHHSDRRPERTLPRLPYYGAALQRHVSGSGAPHDPLEKRYGRIANPTVHTGLNRLRRLVNDVIATYGPPVEIVVEVARELKQSAEEKARIQREQAENQRRNDERRAKLAELGQPDTGENRLRLRLWEELNPAEPHNRRCIYTGEQISIARLFGPEVEIDHILPFSATLDDGAANKIVGMRFANRAKGKRSPFEAFGGSPTVSGFRYDWDEILARADGLPKNKAWRFGPEAMTRFAEAGGFLDRQLIDTQYLARLVREYLAHVCDGVWVTPGRLTAMLRGKWGLNHLLSDHNLKERRDHRHHAIDAFVTALTDRSLLQRIATAAEQSRERLIDDMPEPWEGFRDELGPALDELTVYHRPDHGAQGKLHEETAYGLVADPDAEDGYNLVYRKAFGMLQRNEIGRIRDPDLRRELTALAEAADGSDKALRQALKDFNARRQTAGRTPIRRIRLLKKEDAVLPIRDGDGRAYKAYIPGDNHRIEIFDPGDGSWRGEAVTIFQANTNNHVPTWRQRNPNAKLVMTVHKNDLIALEDGGATRVMRVVRLNAKANRLYLAGHIESGELQKRHDDPEDPFRWLLASYSRLREMQARRVRVDVLGRLHDPGPIA